MPVSPEPFHDEARLRAAQHRVRNDLQTLYNLLLIAEKRMGVTSLPVDEVLRWITSLSAAHDAMPIWKEERPRLRDLISALRSRFDAADVLIAEGDEITVPETSAIAMALAISGILDYYRLRAVPDAPIACRIRETDGKLRLVMTRRSETGPDASWPPFSVVVAVEALRGTCEQSYAGGELQTILVVPCR